MSVTRTTIHIRQNISEMSWQVRVKLRTKVVKVPQTVFLIYQKIWRNLEKSKVLEIIPRVRYYWQLAPEK
jgi:hypothetical protein